MTPSNSIDANLVRRPARAVSFIVKAVWAVIVLALVCTLWLSLFLLFLPFIVLGELVGLKKRFAAAEMTATDKGVADQSPENAVLRDIESQATDHFIFDRRADVSKLFGCNTRNVQYRWAVFSRRLAEIKTQFRSPKAIDFGAGSLRDSYELSRHGFDVVSVDLDESLLQRYSEFYDWQSSPGAQQLFARPLEDLAREAGANSFDLAIAFDVIEHLEDPAAYVRKIRDLLKPAGLFFTIVPNRRSVFERYFKHSIAKMRRKGETWTPGVPHLQFKTPSEWENFFADNGYTVLEHQMAIGPLVNDLWHGLLGLPLTVFVDPVAQTAAHKFRFKYSSAWLEAFYPAWLMERVNLWDVILKEPLRERFGWNLFVVQKSSVRV